MFLHTTKNVFSVFVNVNLTVGNVIQIKSRRRISVNMSAKIW